MSCAPNTSFIANKCRICGMDLNDNNGQAITIFDNNYLEEKMRKYLYINVSKFDRLPRQICAECYVNLENIHQFAYLAQKTEETFLKVLSNKSKTLPVFQRHNRPNAIDIDQKDCVKTSIVAFNNNVRDVKELPASAFSDPSPSPSEDTKITLLPSNEITIYAYDDLKLGQIIKDPELLKLILRALKWDEKGKSSDAILERLKNTSFQDILNTPNLLQDSDIVQLIKSYVGVDAFNNIKSEEADYRTFQPATITSVGSNHCNGVQYVPMLDDCHANMVFNEESVMQIEVGVDPELFLPYDEDETNSESGRRPCRDPSREKTPKCDSIFGNQTANSNGQYKCSTCPDGFNTSIELENHVLKHFIKREEYAEDRDTGDEINDKKVNKRRTRSAKNVCKICGKKLSTKGNLKMHMDTHTPKGKFDCGKCGRVFKTSSNLQRHSVYHSGEKFTCDICGRVYSTNSTLRAHSVSHSNFRPHPCPLCDKTFKRNQDLKFHINQHTGEKPYKCPYCPKAFASSGNCFSHRKRMHPDQANDPTDEEPHDSEAKIESDNEKSDCLADDALKKE